MSDCQQLYDDWVEAENEKTDAEDKLQRNQRKYNSSSDKHYGEIPAVVGEATIFGMEVGEAVSQAREGNEGGAASTASTAVTALALGIYTSGMEWWTSGEEMDEAQEDSGQLSQDYLDAGDAADQAWDKFCSECPNGVDSGDDD